MAEEYDLTSAHSNFRSARARRRAAQAPASIHSEYAINQELDYLASSTFNGYDINQAMEPLPWDPESIDNFQPHPHPGTGGGLVSHHHDPRILPSRSPGEPSVAEYRPLAPNPETTSSPPPMMANQQPGQQQYNSNNNSAYSESYSGFTTPILPNHDPQAQDYGAPFFEDFLPAPTPPEDPLAPVEEEKRRRNTAASARFRVKKKERELALEKTAGEMTERVVQLESKVQGLEMENKWLRGLIVEKSRHTGVEEKVNGVTLRRASASKGKGGEKGRSPSKRTDGVGTRK